MGARKQRTAALTAVVLANAAPAAGSTPTQAEYATVVALLNQTKAVLNAVVAELKK